MQLAINSAFEIQFPGESVPFTLRPGKDNIGAIMSGWASVDDKDFFCDMYPRLRVGLVVAAINGTDTAILDFDAITEVLENYQFLKDDNQPVFYHLPLKILYPQGLIFLN